MLLRTVAAVLMILQSAERQAQKNETMGPRMAH